MKKVFLLLFLYVGQVQAQNIRGQVRTTEGAPLASATVILMVKDSMLHKVAVSDAQGLFSITATQQGPFAICASNIGYVKSCLTGISVEMGYNIQLVLEKQPGTLKEVSVTARKPLLEVKADKMVVNVEGTLNSIGTTALDILRKSPGVNVDSDDNISLSGKSGIQIYIDGRQSPLSGADLSSYLASLQSSQIEAIEIITNPSARYEAAGSGGIINIRLKKNKAYGTNGAVNAGYGIGVFAKYNGGFSINHRNRKLNLFGTYTYAHNRNLVRTLTYRVLADTIFDQQARRTISEQPHNLQAGVDYFVSNTSTIGLLLNAVPGQQVIENKSTTFIEKANAAQYDRKLEALGLGTYKRGNTNVNANYRWLQDGKELNGDIDFGRYHLDLDQFQPNNYYNQQQAFLYSRIYHMVSPSTIHMQALRINYDWNAAKGKISIGGKYGTVNSDNQLERFDVLAGREKMDSLRSNAFVYKENINALYVRYSIEMKKLSLQLGLRAENTNVSAHSSGYKWNNGYLAYDSAFDRRYIDFFPSASVSFKKYKNNQFNINLSRRIDRPAYQDLNPFEFKVDEYVYRKGNTALRPQYTTNIELVHVFKDKVTTIVGYSHVDDVFTQIFDTTEVSRSFITRTNVAKQDVVNLSVNYAIQKGQYNAFVNVNPSYNRYQANFGKNRDLNLEAVAVSIKSQHGYKFRNGYAAEIALIYNSPGIALGFFEGRAFGMVDIAFSRTLINNSLSIKAAMSDLFFTNRLGGTSTFAGQYMDVERTFEPRLFRLNIAYRFGSKTIKSARQRKTLLDEENRRLQTSN